MVLSILFVTSALLAGCASDDDDDGDRVDSPIAIELIEYAESISESDPSEALNIMRKVDRQAIVSDKAQARYALVYSEVCYFNRMLVDCDTLSSIATQYYQTSNNHAERARAFYQHGLVMQMADMMPEAIIALNEAELSLSQIDNPRLEGLVHRTKGDIYRSGYLHSNSYNSFKAARECFDSAGLPYHTHYAEYNMGQAAISMGDYELATPLCYEALDYAISTSDSDFICVILHELCEIYLQQQDYVHCKSIVDMFEEYDCIIWLLSRYYAMCAIVEAEIGNIDKAEQYLVEAEQQIPQDDLIIGRAKYHINKRKGQYEEALQWLMQSIENQSNAMSTALNEPVLNYEIDLLQHTLEREKREAELVAQHNEAVIRHNRVIRQRDTIIYIVIIAMLVPLSLMLLRRSRRRERTIINYMETIKELTHAAESSKNEAYTLFNDRFSDLNRLCETYYEHGNTSREAVKIFEDVKSSIEAMKSDSAIMELEHIVNHRHQGLIRALRTECPKLNDKEIKVIIYSYAGFSTRAISIFLDCDLAALSRLKYKIKQKLHECNYADASIIVANILKH